MEDSRAKDRSNDDTGTFLELAKPTVGVLYQPLPTYCKCRVVLQTLTMTQDRSCSKCAAALKRMFHEAALALASAGSTVRMPQQDASVDM